MDDPGPSRLVSRALAVAVALGLALPAFLAAASGETPEPPPYYAIRDARVVTGTGKTLDRATVLLADGLIEAVGTDLKIPGDAWVIDGQGLTLYPGLIDGLSDLGQAPKEEPSGGPPRGGPSSTPLPRGPEDRPATTPWVSAADLQGKDARVEKWREAGFTAAISSPTSGIFAGQAALVHLGEAEPRERVLRTPVAQRINFETAGGFRTFPGSLMGVLADIDQTLLDARHDADLRSWALTHTLERPVTYDRSLEPLEQALTEHLPFLIPADLGRHIDRALAMEKKHDLAAVIYGAQGGYARAEALRKSGTPVIVGLDWPKEAPDRDPDADTPFRTLAHRQLAPTTPKALADAGVVFGFSSQGLTGPSQIFENLRKAIDAGLDPGAALTALTAGAAKVYGVDDRLGTIEAGKIANLVLATAEPWAKDVEIRAVFVDGRKYEKHEEEEASEPPAADVSGSWALTLVTPRGNREMKAELTMAEDGKVTGEVTSERGTTTVDDGRMSGALLRFSLTRTMEGQSRTSKYSLTVAGEQASGTVSAGPMTFDLSGERTRKPEPGAVQAKPEAPRVKVAEIEEGLRLYQGPVPAPGDFAIRHARVYTVSGETIDDGTVVVRGGKIAAVGRDVQVPEGVEVIDAGGGSLIPGIIDAHSHIAVEGGVNEGSLAVTAMVAIRDVLDPDDVDIYRALAGGVTSANILHGSANPIGGQNAVIKLRWGADAEGLVFEGAPPGIKFALGENPKRSNVEGSDNEARYPQSRMGVMDVIRQAFTEARAYSDEQKRWKKGDAPLRYDRKLEALAEILEGRRKVHAHCYRADEILQLMRLAEEQGFHIATLQHVLEGYKVADEIAAHGAGASTFSDWWGYKIEAYDAIPHNAALMTERGVVVSINSDSAEEMRHLNQEAAKCMKWGGLDELEALKLVTLNPARQLQIDDRVGSIEVGKDADLVLYDGPPLGVRSVVQKTFVDGVLYFDRDADRERQATIEDLEKRLLGKADESAKDAAPEKPATEEKTP